jgi:hypothetical protein
MNYLTSGCYEECDGAWRPNVKVGKTLPPDTIYAGVKFNKTILNAAGSKMTAKINANSLGGVAAPGSLLYQGGFLDVDGSFPCVAPGSYVFHNTPGVVTKNCEFRSNWNMFVCPPLPQGVKYRQLDFIPRKQYTYYPNPNNLNVTWECNNALSIPPGPENMRAVNVRTDKRYHVQFDGWEAPGVHIRPNTDLSNNVVLEPTEVIFIYPGKWTFTYWNVYGDNDQWSQNTKDISVQCACGVTYAKIIVSGELGTEIRATSAPDRACNTTCGNPWPIPAPTGYSCSDNRVVTNTKNVNTCPGKPLRTTPRYQYYEPLTDFLVEDGLIDLVNQFMN